MGKIVLVCDRYTEESIQYLKSNLDCEIRRSHGRVPTYDEIASAQVLLTRSRTFLNKELLSCAKKLELVITATSGFDHIDVRECEKIGVTVMHTPEANIDGAAQLTLLLTLSLMRNLLVSHNAVISHMWKEELPVGLEISGKNLGLIGFGRVGKKVAHLFKAFDANVFAHDPYIAEAEFTDANVTPLGLSELLRQSDIVSLHAPLTRETENMMNRKTLDLMSEESYLINVSRGALVNESDLIEALEVKQIAGAALDVFQKEPLPRDSKLRQLKNVTLTPHIGAYTKEAFAKASLAAVKKVVRFFEDKEVTDGLPPKVDWFRQHGH